MVPLPAGPHGPRASLPPGAAFEVRGGCAVANGSGEVGGGGEWGPAEIHVVPWDYRFLLCFLLKIYIYFLF